MHGGTSPGAPAGNQHATRHGAYASVLRDALCDEDASVYDGAPVEPAAALDETLRALSVREVRVLRFLSGHPLDGGAEKALTDIQNAKLRAIEAKGRAESGGGDASGLDEFLAAFQRG